MRKSPTDSFRLRKNDEIKKVICSGLSVSCSGMKFFYLPNGRNGSRFAVSLRRGYGIAVARNRVKRQVKEIVRNYKASIKPGYDMVCLVFPKELSFWERTDLILIMLKRANLLEEIRNP